MDEGVEGHHLSGISPPKKVTVSCRYTCKGICMAAFMEESGARTRIGQSCSRGSLRSHSETIALRRSPSPRHQFSGRQIRNWPAQRRWPANNCNVCPAGTTSGALIMRGSDAAVPLRLVILTEYSCMRVQEFNCANGKHLLNFERE
jgi:hypothetical protein